MHPAAKCKLFVLPKSNLTAIVSKLIRPRFYILHCPPLITKFTAFFNLWLFLSLEQKSLPNSHLKFWNLWNLNMGHSKTTWTNKGPNYHLKSLIIWVKLSTRGGQKGPKSCPCGFWTLHLEKIEQKSVRHQSISKTPV